MNEKYKLYRDGNFYNTVVDSFESAPLKTLSSEEKLIREKFQAVLTEKEKEFPFHLNDSIYIANP